jgi:hypothetical protein
MACEIPMSAQGFLPRPDIIAVSVETGVACHQGDGLRLFIRQAAPCPARDVCDVHWWRDGQDLCVGADAWSQAQRLPQLGAAAWDRLNAGAGQWWVLDDRNAVVAVFQLTSANRCA